MQAARGDAEGARRALRAVEGKMGDVVGAMWTAPVAQVHAEAALWLGRPAEASAVVQAELGRRETVDASEVMYLAPLLAAGARAEADLAVAARAVSDAAELERIAGRAVRMAEIGQELVRADPQPDAVLHVEQTMLETARATAAATEEAWRVLSDRWDARGNAFLAAYCRWRAAELVLAAGGPRGDVQDMLEAALRTARRLRAEPLRREITDLARRGRVQLSEAGAGGEEAAQQDEAEDASSRSDAERASAAERIGLTPRELDVLKLMAGGATNREIAAILFISQKTVTVHVTRILAKLDVRTRVEAAGVAQRLGLLEEALTRQ
jgi:DNA-binding CsgD family transcriptional regulator